MLESEDPKDSDDVLDSEEDDPLTKAVESMGGGSVPASSMAVLEEQPSLQIVSTVPSTDNTTLQSLLSGVQTSTAQLISSTGQPETIEIITVSGHQNDMLIGDNKQVWQLIPTVGSHPQAIIVTEGSTHVSHEENRDGLGSLQHMTASDLLAGHNLLPIQSNLPDNCPQWAARLRDCEVIGTSYRGWVESEVELDLLLTYHKQQTQSFWGTRQSPSTSKPASRLMWRSQYVPFDGVPFVNSGSRAVVMECQFGPRRKGAQAKREAGYGGLDFKQTCPARIYVKKVRKIPEYSVPLTLDKKSMKMAMDRVFQELKQQGLDNMGQERYYVQLPTEGAHDFHGECAPNKSFMQAVDVPKEVASNPSTRVDNQVALKIRELVADGETRLYAIRKQLRRYVEKELFCSAEEAPERHNLCFFPTVHDIQNHIHQALKDIESGILPVTAPNVNVEVMTSTEGQENLGDGMIWPNNTGDEDNHAETVTVTLTQNPGEDGQHVISRVETHMSDGSTQVSHTISPETAQLLSKLHPNMFPAGTLMKMHSPPASLPNLQFAMGDCPQETTFQIVQGAGDLVQQEEGVVSVSDIHEHQVESPDQSHPQLNEADSAGL